MINRLYTRYKFRVFNRVNTRNIDKRGKLGPKLVLSLKHVSTVRDLINERTLKISSG